MQCITEAINWFQKQEREGLQREWREVKGREDEDEIVDFEYRIILYINNYNECLRHAGESKELFS